MTPGDLPRLDDPSWTGANGGASPAELPEAVGERLRSLRQRRRMTLREVAERADLSEGFISQIERGKANASVKSLRRIATVLGSTIGELFAPPVASGVRVMRDDERPGLSFGVDATKYLLTPGWMEQLEVLRVHLEPGGSTGEEPYSHGDSEELCLVLQGELELVVGEERFLLGPGDSIGYRSSTAHTARNAGPGVAEVVWVISPPSY